MNITANRVMNGTFGAVWVNGERWFDVNEFEAKASIDYEDINMAGDLGTDRKMLGWNGEGTITTKKVYSRGAAIVAEAIKTGVQPDITIVGKLDDPSAFGAERVSIERVTFNEATLLKFEQKTAMTEELPFAFGGFELIDLVNS